MDIKRNILLNPGPATTTDSVKLAQVVPDICPREKEFAALMDGVRDDLVRIVHGDPDKHTAVLFCGSGTICMDVCLNSLLPANRKVLVVNNGSYSQRAAEICAYYGLNYMELRCAHDETPDMGKLEEMMKANLDIAVVYSTHHETGTGLLNPVREIGEMAHRHGAASIVDTTSSYGMLPIDMEEDNIDFCMASAQKGIMAMTGLSFVVGSRKLIEASKDYPKRSYYCNLYMQHDYFERTGEMHFTPPVQAVYAARQALKEYWAEGEQAKQERHARVFAAIQNGLEKLGFKSLISREKKSGLVEAAIYPDDANWDFEKVHDYCHERGYTIYPGKTAGRDSFRLCAFGAIDREDIEGFFAVLEEALHFYHVQIPVRYD